MLTKLASTVIISTRGTGEPQGPSSGFRTMIRNTLAAVPGGIEYDTVYPADFSQISTAGTNDVSTSPQYPLISSLTIFSKDLAQDPYWCRQLPWSKVCALGLFSGYV
jgi:hypothetical protein